MYYTEQKDFAVILNANAKQVSKRVVAHISEFVSQDDLFFSTHLKESLNITREIISRGYQTVFTGGGDGTASANSQCLTTIATKGCLGSCDTTYDS